MSITVIFVAILVSLVLFFINFVVGAVVLSFVDLYSDPYSAYSVSDFMLFMYASFWPITLLSLWMEKKLPKENR